MKTTLLSTLVTFIGINLISFVSSAAVIEGHFYASTCGENMKVPPERSIHQAMNMRILIRERETAVLEVCHGNVLKNGEYIETVRLNLDNPYATVAYVDFQITEKYIEQRADRALMRKALIKGHNPELGDAEFFALVNFKSGDVVSIKTTGQIDQSVLSFETQDMEKMMNIQSTVEPSASR